jgi:hypothetical protein
MPEQRQKDVLHDVLAVASCETASAHVPKQGIAKQVEQDEDVLLEMGLFESLDRLARRERREAQCGLWLAVRRPRAGPRRVLFAAKIA